MKRGQKIVQFNQIWVFQNAGGTKRERFISCLCNSDRTLAERGVKRVAPSLLRHPNSSEGSRVSTGIWRNHDLAANLVRWLKFLTQQCYKDVVKGGKKQCKHTHTHTSILFPHLGPAVGPADVSALFMQIPFCSSVTMEYCSLSPSLAPLHVLPSARPPSQEFPLDYYLFRVISETLFPPLLTVFCTNI